MKKVAGGEKIEVMASGSRHHPNGVIEDSPNFPAKAKGFALQSALSSALSGNLPGPRYTFFQRCRRDGRGIAATRGKLNKLFRVWTIGNGIGFGRFPSREGIWKAGIPSSPSIQGKFLRLRRQKAISKDSWTPLHPLRFMDLEPRRFLKMRALRRSLQGIVTLCHRALARRDSH